MKANVDLINARKSENELIVQKAKFVEEFEQAGLTTEDLKKEARDVLGLDDNGIVMLEYASVMSEQNKKIFAFTQIANQLAFIENAKVLKEEEVATIRNSLNVLGEEVAKILRVDVEDLYEEVDEDFLTGKEN